MGNIQKEIEKEKKAQVLAGKVMKSVQQEIISYMPYLNRAILQMPVLFYTPKEDVSEVSVSFGTDGENFYALASIVMQMFEQSDSQVIRLYLHLFTYERLNTQYWDLAADMAAENVILNFHWKRCEIDGDDVRRRVLNQTLEKCGRGNAETIYAYLCDHEKERNELLRYAFMFRQDRHDIWTDPEKQKKQDPNDLQKQWKEIEKNIQLDAENYEKARGLQPGTISKKFNDSIKKKEDYTSILRKFLVNQEEMRTDPDTFDYVYYTYGLQLYENMPLIEPLEYRMDHHIKDFVIAIDTSGSTKGELVKSFLQKTYDVLTSTDAFGEQMHVVILQCDAKVQEEVIIQNQQELDTYIHDFTIRGLGGTDFRPVFARVEELKQNGTLQDIRGLLYFTDGEGEYPKNMPSYKTAFVGIEDPKIEMQVPSWAVKVSVSEEELER
jgi:predicted metal-dependent peptidase